MYKYVLRSIEGVGIYPAIALVLFFAVFVGVLVRIWLKGNQHWKEVARLPLDNDESIQS